MIYGYNDIDGDELEENEFYLIIGMNVLCVNKREYGCTIGLKGQDVSVYFDSLEKGLQYFLDGADLWIEV